jgi:hypothetical protein
MAKNGGSGKGGKRVTGSGGAALSPLALIGFVLFAVSWFVPVLPHQGLLAGLGGLTREFGSSPEAAAAGLDGPEWLPGWSACRFAWQLLIDGQPQGGGDEWKQRLAGASCLTNLAMLGAMLAVLARRPRAPLGTVLLGCAVLDASWVYLAEPIRFDTYSTGYWLWLGSFVLAGLGLLLPAKRA